MTDQDRAIQGVAKTVNQVLSRQKYAIDYYQREYRWESKQLAELVADLTTKFQDVYESGHARGDVAKYPGYYLGSIILSRKQGEPYIVDGQQRLTSLTLLLVYLWRLQQDSDEQVDIKDLIYSEKFGSKSFNLDVSDRNECMEALLATGEYEPPTDAPESVQNLAARYGELDTLFPKELRDVTLPFFIDWLIERVQLVEITAYTDDDAYAIFETMNDRGLKLTSADMLKGYLLANMADGAPRTTANDLWRKRLRKLNDYDEDAGADFLKTWLRSQYATKIRERKAGARAEDWDRIGTEFHRWARSAHEDIGLISKQDHYEFVTRDLDFYSRQYERILNASRGTFASESPLRFIRFNADLGFTLQNQLLLAPLRADDPKVTVDRKLEIVGRYVDILLAWRIWNFRSTAYSTMSYAMFLTMREIRGLDAAQLAQTLHGRLQEETETFDSNDELYVHQQNRSQLHKILARLTDYVTMQSERASNYFELTNGTGIRYEVEHVWADHADQHTSEFTHPADFARHRNRIGDLLLLPKQFKASYGDLPYKGKQPHYYGQNLLAASLNPLCYQNNPGFTAFVEHSGLAFKPYDEFRAASIVERGELYRDIAKQVWDPDDLLAVARDER